MRPVFDAFRTAVLALDPGISEEVLKLYVAYKAETNFRGRGAAKEPTTAVAQPADSMNCTTPEAWPRT